MSTIPTLRASVEAPSAAAPTTVRQVSRRPARAIVIEGTGDRRPDRLDDELAIVERLALPVDADRLDRLIAASQPTLVLCKHSLDSGHEALWSVCRTRDVDVFVLAHPVYGSFRPARLHRFGGLPWLRLRRRGWAGPRAKRFMDIALVLSGLPLLLPLMLLVLLANCFDGPPLYTQTRVGAGGRPFRMVKFRTMRPDAESVTGPCLSGPGDARVSRLGRILRRTRIDELPQLWNVLRGEMSLVGPRPERPEFVAELRQLPDYDLRHLIQPGITGIAQLTGGYTASAEEKLRCDLFYLHYRSLRSDLMLLLLTLLELVRGFPRG